MASNPTGTSGVPVCPVRARTFPVLSGGPSDGAEVLSLPLASADLRSPMVAWIATRPESRRRPAGRCRSCRCSNESSVRSRVPTTGMPAPRPLSRIPLLRDETITEVMVNGPRHIYIERGGKIERIDSVFLNDEHVLRIIDRIISPMGRRIDESSPRVDARLPDGSRVNAVISPLSLVGPVITVRKFAARPFTVEVLIRFGTATAEMFDFLKTCIEARLNIFVSGGTGSGKTTTLNVLSSFIPEDERIITIEDAAELQLRQTHVAVSYTHLT